MLHLLFRFERWAPLSVDRHCLEADDDMGGGAPGVQGD